MEGPLRIGLAITGSFCTFSRILEQIRKMTATGMEITPILSFNAATTDTRFGTAAEFIENLTEATGQTPLTTLTEVEPIGPQALFDILVCAPCTGSTLARLACGLSDTPVTLAVKSHLRRSRPVVIAVSTNDALGASMRNIALLKNAKHMYFVPLRQDDPVNKPNSLVADFSLIENTIAAALAGTQIQPLLG